MKLVSSLLFVFTLASINVFACDGSCKHGHMKEMTKEQRAQAATMHEKMATCLKDETKDIKKCHEEMMESSPFKGEEMSCNGEHEGKGEKHHGKHGHEKMHGDDKAKAAEPKSDETKK